MKIVVALGGNALSRRGEQTGPDAHIAGIARAAAAIAPLCAAGHEIVVTQGEGPQWGILALQAAATPDTPYPLDVLDVGGSGIIGHLIEQALLDVLPGRSLVVTLVTQVEVDRADPAFQHPAMPVGRAFDESEARTLAAERGWRIMRDRDGWRRAVASPKPLAVLEARAVEMLVHSGAVVICLGGGIPVVRCGNGALAGVEALIDKDIASSLLARQIGAHWLVMLTDVSAVYENFGGAKARRLESVTPQQLWTMRFDQRSMAPKIEAACSFVSETGGRAAIGRLEALEAILAGKAGTQIAAARS